MLQNDLNALLKWEERWQMAFNPEKCETLRVTNKTKNIIKSSYSIRGTELRNVTDAKYLGVTINNKLKWNGHINNICKKANSTRGFLQRNLRRCSTKVKEQAYHTYVRPTLEYASTVWNPYTAELVKQMEMIQRRAARFVVSDFHRRHSVTSMLQNLQWASLQERRAHSDVIMVYRIMNGLVAIPVEPYFVTTSPSTRGHSIRLLQPHCRIQAYQYSFFPRVVHLWNDLPASVVTAPTLETFKNRLTPLELC